MLGAILKLIQLSDRKWSFTSIDHDLLTEMTLNLIQLSDRKWLFTSIDHNLLTEMTLVSGLNEAQVLDVLSQKEFSERQSDR